MIHFVCCILRIRLHHCSLVGAPMTGKRVSSQGLSVSVVLKPSAAHCCTHGRGQPPHPPACRGSPRPKMMKEQERNLLYFLWMSGCPRTCSEPASKASLVQPRPAHSLKNLIMHFNENKIPHPPPLPPPKITLGTPPPPPFFTLNVYISLAMVWGFFHSDQGS